MNIITLIREFRSLIHEDGAIAAWCQANYGHDVETYIGVDERNPPPPGPPMVHLLPGSKDTGAAVESKEHNLTLICEIFDEDEAEVVYPGANEMQSVARLEEFRILVLAAIRRTTIEGLIFKQIHVEYEPVEFFPSLLAGLELTIEQPRAFREDPYE